MKYFSNFPKLINSDGAGTATLATNLLARVNIVPNLLDNPLLYYTYAMQDGDTPEIIATKYYNNPYRYWIFLYGNEVIDPQWDLPLSQRNFQSFLDDKYKAAANSNNQTVIAYTQSTIKYYEKLVLTYDSNSNITTTNAFIVDQETYANLPVNLITTRYFPSGSYTKVTQSRQTKTIYDYELESNEAKRETRIINETYADDMEDKLKSLLAT
jgi:hypothetical protein